MKKSLILTSLLCATILQAGDVNATVHVDKNITTPKTGDINKTVNVKDINKSVKNVEKKVTTTTKDINKTVNQVKDANKTVKNVDKNITVTKKDTISPCNKEDAVKYIIMLEETLKSHLETEMKADKTGLKAIDFCTTKAIELTKEVNSKLPKGVSVRRTSLLTRNEANKADDLDIAVMNQIINDINKTDVNISKPLMVETPSSYRVYKPIITTAVCLKCHGNSKTITKEIQKKIIKNYPKDKAVGFKEGDLRGVIISEIQK